MTLLKESYQGSRGGSCFTKWLPAHKYSLNRPKKTEAKNTPKIAPSALSGDPSAVTAATNYSIFIKCPWVKLSELKRGFLHHKVAPRPQTQPELAKKCLAKITPKIACSPLSGDATVVTSVANHSILIKCPYVKVSGLKRGLLHHKVAPRPQMRPE